MAGDPETSKHRFRVAVVGCGPIGAMHAKAAQAHPEVELVAVCAPSPKHRDPLASQLRVTAHDSFERMLVDAALDCVFIASPDQYHIEHAMQALEARVHVFCEKPLGCDSSQAEQVCELAKANGLFCGVNFNRRYGFGYRQAARLLADGAIGDLRQMWLQVTDATPPPHVAQRSDIMLWTLLGHHFDLILFLAGQVNRVGASMRSDRSDQLVDDLTARFELASGGFASLDAAYRNGQERTTERCELVGTKGGIVIDDVTHEVRWFGKDPDRVTRFRPNPFLAGDAFYESLRRHIEDFLSKVIAGQPPRVAAGDAVRATRLAEAILESNRQQQIIQL